MRLLLTLHGYGTWMPDHPRGYVKRGAGIQRPQPALAAHQRQTMTADAVFFSEADQRRLIEAVQHAVTFIDVTLFAAGSDATHLHLLLGWRHNRTPKSIRKSLKRGLRKQLGLAKTSPLFAQGGDCKPVKDGEHHEHLRNHYLRKHPGWYWDSKRCWHTPVAAYGARPPFNDAPPPSNRVA